MSNGRIPFSFTVIAVLALSFAGTVLASTSAGLIHDAEHYLLEAQHGEKWAAEDQELDAKLAALKAKYGQPPNIIHIMWDDTALGEIGIPEIQKVRGFETSPRHRRASLSLTMYWPVLARGGFWYCRQPPMSMMRRLLLRPIPTGTTRKAAPQLLAQCLSA